MNADMEIGIRGDNVEITLGKIIITLNEQQAVQLSSMILGKVTEIRRARND